MLNTKGLIRYKFLIPIIIPIIILIIILILIYPLAVQKAAGISSIGYEAPIYEISLPENTQYEVPTYEISVSEDIQREVPIYEISFPENTQRDIWKLCEQNHLSYELVLAIFQIDGVNNTQIDSIKAEIGKLVYHRDYWTEQGFPDESVFALMLLSKQRGIEGCIIFIKDNDSYDLDKYVQKVAEYKYYLEQSLDAPSVI